MEIKLAENVKNVDIKTQTPEASFEKDSPIAGESKGLVDNKAMEKQFESESPLEKGEDINSEKFIGCPIDGNNGHWSGERGNSDWIPDDNYVPIGQHTNPEGKTWKEIKEQYGFDKIPFKDGEPDFSEVAKATVKIDNFTDKRTGKGGNFDQADQKIMEGKR